MDQTRDEFDLNDETLRRAADAVGALPKAEPPADLASRTVARVVKECRQFQRRVWLLRPITHPLARFAAAALIILTLTPMTSLNIAAPLGSKIEERIIGRQMTDRIEDFVDGLLVIHGPASYSQTDLDEFMGVKRHHDAPRRPMQKSSGAPQV